MRSKLAKGESRSRYRQANRWETLPVVAVARVLPINEASEPNRVARRKLDLPIATGRTRKTVSPIVAPIFTVITGTKRSTGGTRMSEPFNASPRQE